jgi:RsiW-degrading membrane proteinase PrsW (M82 family)
MSRTAAAVSAWFRQQRSKYYWKVLAVGVAAWVVAGAVAATTSNLLAPPQIMLIGAAVVPLCVLIFWYEECGLADIPLILLLLAVAGGVTVGLSLGGLFDTSFVNANANSSLGDGLMVGLCEETAKGIVILLFLRSTRLTRSLHGLLIGVAVGAGFAIGETMGYGFVQFSQVFMSGGDFGTALSLMNSALLNRGVLAVFGHVTWSGIIGAAIWRERRGSRFAPTSGVALAFAIAVVMHGLWDGTSFIGWPSIPFGQLQFPIFDTLVVGPLGLITLSFFVYEDRQRAKLATPPPLPPLATALKDYYRRLAIFLGLMSSAPRVVPVAPKAASPSTPPQWITPLAVPIKTESPLPGAPVQPSPPTSPAVFCAHCGARSVVGAAFCSRCGHPLGTTSAT